MNRNRREFIKSSVLLATGMMGVQHFKKSSAAESPESSLTIACRDAHLREVNAPDVWQAAKKIQAQGVEVWVDDQRGCPNLFGEQSYSIKDGDAIRKLGDDAAENGVKITAFALANRFDERVDFEKQWLKDVIQAAEKLGVKAIRIDVVPRKIKDETEFLKFAIQTGKEICELVTGINVKYGIENHGRTTNKPEFLEALFASVGSEALGLTLDTGNFYWFGHPLDSLYGIYEKFAPRAYHTHCKSIDYPKDKENSERDIGWKYGEYSSPIYKGDIVFSKVIAILQEAGYQNDLCIENESLGRFPEDEREEILRKEVQYLKELST